MSMALTRAERTSILEALSSADEEVRRLAVEQLLLLPISEAAEKLCECLGDSSWRVRKAAVGRLVTRGGEAPIQEMLIASLADGENPGRRNSAFEALVGCGARVTARLVAEMASEDADVRKLVVDALAAIGDPGSRESLVSAIEDVDPNVRASATEALGVVGGSQEFESLMRVACIADEDVLVRLSALRALSRMEADVGVARLEDALENSLLRPAAFELLGHSLDPAAVEALVKGLSIGGPSSREKAMAALLRTLGRLDDREAGELRTRLREAVTASGDLIEACCERLDGADLGSRMILVQFLGLIADSRAIVPILLAGRDEAIEELAEATLVALGEIVPTALAEAWDDLDSSVKARACTVLGKIGGPCADRLLSETLGSFDGELRCRAASALAEGAFYGRVLDLVRSLEVAALHEASDGSDEVATIVAAIVQLAERSEEAETGIDVQLIEVLSSRLGGASEPVRLAIAQVFAYVGREQDEDVIDYLLKDESPAVRRAAVHALGRFAFEHARNAIRLALADESSSVRIAAAKVLGDSGRSEATEELRGLIADDDSRVVAVAIRSVGRLHGSGETATEEIYELVGNALSAEPIVALAACEALDELGGARAGALARSALQCAEPDVVRAAVVCLGAHGGEDDLAEAIELIAHLDWSVRAEIAQVLSARGYRKSLPALLRRLEVEDDAFVRQVILRAISRLEQ
jgi:HEAT repeat protein